MLLAASSFATVAAVPVAPFMFGSSPASTDSAKWDQLMKYKLWAEGNTNETAIFLYGNVHITDTVGYVGSPKGSLELTNVDHDLGGPILFGGGFKNGDGDDVFMNGPIHFKQKFSVSGNSKGKNHFNGYYCFEGGIENFDSDDFNPNSDDCSKVLPIDDLTLPSLSGSYTYDKTLGSVGNGNQGNKDYFIDVPIGTGAYDIKISSITMNNTGTVFVRMPPHGRPTRIFITGNVSFSNSTSLKVIYAKEESQWNDTTSQWRTTAADAAPDSLYNGDLLVYFQNGVYFDAGNDGRSIQGTLISPSTINVRQHMSFAGQLIAKKIEINADFKADQFRYVPFDPPKINSTALASGLLHEGKSKETLNVKLDKAPSVPVKITYCFAFEPGASAGSGKTGATGSVITAAHSSDLSTSGIPVCSMTGTSPFAEATFTDDGKALINPIQLTAVDDELAENREYFYLRILNITGGVLENGGHSGNFKIYIEDNDNEPSGKDTIITATLGANGDSIGYEDVPFKISSFPAYYSVSKNGSVSQSPMSSYKVKVVSVPGKGTLKNGTATVTAGSTLTSSDITSGKLTFTSAPNEFGDSTASFNYTSFTFKIVDSYGDMSKSTYKMTIQVLPVNDKPLFDKSKVQNGKLSVSIPENSPVDTGLTTVTAQDSVDSNRDSKNSLTYKLVNVSGSPSSVFQVNSKTGAITVKAATLDYETQKTYEMKIVVTDNGVPGNRSNKLTDTILVHVDVTNVNEPPIIEQEDYEFKVDENSAADAFVGEINVTDEDTNDNLTLSIIGSSIPFSVKSVNSRKFNLVVAQGAKLDFETKNSYTFKVRVTDGEKSDTSNVVVKINDVNEKPVISDYTFNVDENSPKGKKVGTVKVKDVDTWTVMKYELKDSTKNIANVFTITPASSCDNGYFCGDIKLKDSVLDFEKTAVYYMYVIATDNGKNAGFPPDMADTAVVTIKINDVDEPPVIKPTATDVNVKEHENSGKFLAGYKVTDPDKNHTLTFSMEAADGHTSLPFTLTPVSGKDSAYIKTNKELDYETMDTLYKVRVIVTDNGGSRDTANLTVRIKDINEAPAFGQPDYKFKINEKYSGGQTVGTLTATDKDTFATPKTALTYSLGEVRDVTNSNSVVTGLFSITSSNNKGVIKVVPSGVLGQAYAGKTYEVEVTVTDNGASQSFFDNKKNLSAKVMVTITVSNENDPPIIDSASYTFRVDENSTKGTLVGNITVTDEDTGDKLTFSIVPPSGTTLPFTYETVSDREFKLVVAQGANLDYEKDSVYKFKVAVSDGIATDSADVTVKINDVNEKPNIVTADLYIDENSAVGESVGNVQVTDQDLWTKMSYKLLDSTAGATSIFKIASNSTCASGYFCGEIKVNKSVLNYEKDSVYYLYVVATDNGSSKGFPPDLADTALLKVHVNDKNDPPTFDSSSVTVGVDENSPVETLVGSVSVYAKDEDNLIKKKDTLVYSLIPVSKNSTKFFKIDSLTGEIKVAEDSLDYETVAVYQVKVRVTDNRGPQSADTMLVIINVNDVNEKPTIAQQKFSVDEMEPVGTVLNGSPVKDGDLDTAKAFKMHKYFAIDGDTAKFAIDSLTGALTTKEVLTYSNTGANDYSLTVKVVDYSVPSKLLVAEEVMLITVNDVNKAPVIAPDTFLVKENSPESTFVGQLQATDDEDLPSQITFALVGTSKEFDVSSDGIITVKKGANIDYERIKSYTLQVEVADLKGLTSIGKVVINVENVPEPPVIEADTFHVAETAAAKTLVGKAIGMDQEDADSLLTYTLIGTSDEFEVSTSGRITVKKSGVLDYETTTSYILEIYVTDTDSMSDTARFLILVDDVNEAPVIEPAEFHVAENSPAKTKVGTVVAHDAEDPDSVLVFSLAEKSNEFEISSSGRITVKSGANLDYETKNRYELKVSVTDTKNASSTAIVKILIDDVREIPTIDDTTIVIREDAKPDTTFAKLIIDNPENDDVKVTLITKTNVFKVSEKGEITLIDTLDYESKKKYDLVVVVKGDDGSLDTAHVTIKVQNVVEIPDVKITRATDEDSLWLEPDTIFTNSKRIDFEWTVDKKMQPDTTVKFPKDSTYIVKVCYDDPTKDKPGCDSVVVVVDNSIPKVTISKTAEDTAAISNVTIVEQVDENDTNFYVNHELNEVRIHVKDKATKTDSTFKTNLRLDSLLNIKNSLSDIKKISKKNSITMDDAESADETKKTLINDKVYAVSFETEVDGKTVKVSYNTDKNGKKIKNDDGDVVMTVEYKTVVGGKDVIVSYKVNGSTGELIKNDNGGSYEYAYEFDDEFGGHVGVRYSVDDKGEIVKNEEGNYGYQVSYTYKNKFGNVATKNIFIVVDKVVPVVKIVTPENKSIVRTRGVAVEWTVDGVVQDTLAIQGLKKGLNPIVRTYRDKAGNEASDTVFVVMKNPKDVNVHVVKPVTIINADSVEKYYGNNPPKEGQSFAVSLYNPYEDKEAKTLVGGSFGKKDADGEEPYAGLNGGHLGPTLAFDFVTPRCGENPASGLCTLDDLLERDGLISLDVGGGWDREKVTVDEYVNNYCSKEFRKEFNGDLKSANLYKITLHVSVWIYTNLGGFLNEYHFKQEINDPQYVDEVGQSKMFFELSPDLQGDVRTADGRMLGTGAYLFKTSIKSVAELRCKLPDEEIGHKRYATDELLKSFGYKRPKQK
jgi:hypothetical protein